MLDDRQIAPSSRPRRSAGRSRESNEFGWRGYLGDLYGADVPRTAAPAARRTSPGLPPALVFVGGADGFHDEDIDYALRLNQAGVPTELHVLPGAPHGVGMFTDSGRGAAMEPHGDGVAGAEAPIELPARRVEHRPLRRRGVVAVGLERRRSGQGLGEWRRLLRRVGRSGARLHRRPARARQPSSSTWSTARCAHQGQVLTQGDTSRGRDGLGPRRLRRSRIRATYLYDLQALTPRSNVHDPHAGNAVGERRG